MISVEQVRALEERIEKALSYISTLREEKNLLEQRLTEAEAHRGRAEARADQAETRAKELEAAIAAFRSEQARIEEGIIHALEKLDAFEDLVLGADTGRRAETPSASQAKQTPEAPVAENAASLAVFPVDGSPAEPPAPEAATASEAAGSGDPAVPEIQSAVAKGAEAAFPDLAEETPDMDQEIPISELLPPRSENGLLSQAGAALALPAAAAAALPPEAGTSAAPERQTPPETPARPSVAELDIF